MELSIIVVNWNTKQLLRRCLQSVQDTVSGVGFEIIVIDNASSDGSLEMVRQDFPDARLISNTTNLGFAKATNQGIAVSKGDYILLLNSDAMLQERAVEQMVAFLQERKDAGAVGPALVLPDGSYQLGAAGFEFSLGTAFNHYFFLSRLFPLLFRALWLQQRDSFRYEIEVDWVSGASLMARSEVLASVGGLDSSYFMYMEDVEWCRRVRQQGWKVFYLPFTRVIHHYRASGSKDASAAWMDSVDTYYRLHHGRVETILFHLIATFGFLMRSLLYVLGSVLTKRGGLADKGRLMLAYARKSLSLTLSWRGRECESP